MPLNEMGKLEDDSFERESQGFKLGCVEMTMRHRSGTTKCTIGYVNLE